MNTRIEWCDAVWNPVTGCTKVSAGCKHCYAERFAGRQMGIWKGREFNDVRCHTDRLEAPLHWRKPRRVFVNSMGDLFHEDVPFDFIAAVYGIMAACSDHTFIVLTKRVARAVDFYHWLESGQIHHPEVRSCTLAAAKLLRERFARHVAPGAKGEIDWPLPNLWLGVSVEDQAAAEARIPLLLQTPVAVRVVSAEPLLGPVGIAKLNGIDWVIVGGESGPNARHCNISWIRSLLDQCLENKVSCFIKQLGSNPVYEIGDRLVLQSKKGNDMEEWPNGIRVRQWPEGER